MRGRAPLGNSSASGAVQLGYWVELVGPAAPVGTYVPVNFTASGNWIGNYDVRAILQIIHPSDGARPLELGGPLADSYTWNYDGPVLLQPNTPYEVVMAVVGQACGNGGCLSGNFSAFVDPVFS